MQKLKKLSSIFTLWGGKQTLKTPDASQLNTSRNSLPNHIQNFSLVWLDSSIDDVSNADTSNTISRLQELVNTINTFSDADRCISFLTSTEGENILLIISGALGEIIVPTVHDMTQIHSMYVFCRNASKHKQWAQRWPKVRGMFTEILPLCEALKQTAQQYYHSTISIGFVSTDEELSKQNLDQINQSFMYTQILKEIILTIEFNQQSIQDFLVYCRQKFANNSIELDNINKLEREYHQHQPIWWYTYECFLYSMLNRALRTMEFDIIMKMGFFIRDLYEDIDRLHVEQLIDHHKSDSFTVYRGQGLAKTDFNQLVKTKGGLLSFNSFLSTSKNHNVSLNFARHSMLNSDLIGVLFVMTIDPCLSSTRFASIKNVSCHQTEREILFSMHSIFRIGHIRQIEHDNDRLWQVELKSTNDDDPQRHKLTERIRQQTMGLTGWHSLGQLLIMIDQFSKAEDLYKVLLKQSDDEYEKAHFNHHLGVIKEKQGVYDMAIHFYEKSLEINRQILAPDHHYLASSYNGIGMAYMKKGDYAKALSSHEKSLQMFEKTLGPNDCHVGISYGNIGKVYNEMGELSKALSYHKKALKIFKKTLSDIDPYMATSYYDIGKVYEKMGELPKALYSHEKAFEIRKTIFPPDHHSLVTSCNIIRELHVKMQKDSEGQPRVVENAINLEQCSLPVNHLELFKEIC
ncbi:unnamed protein product [Rotaria magnacalcarata]|uniref:NAD(P)(+)--arginine ADP-ribosyltransferase n=1 Tax=Rotaria magnacalcarata TaxID=392030 RepID=A0A819N719_9BILA|nr:unnamed protein product [Rotaria magnacalcarata]CAF3990481.1 unnamed protein product [Rotaria magnacalcarata]